MCTAMMATGVAALGVGLSATSAYDKAVAANKAAAYNAQVSDANAATSAINADYADKRADSIIKAGAQAETQQRMKTAQLVGAQRAGFAASGVVVDSGSAADAVADTKALGEMDAQTIRTNARNDADAAYLDAYNFRRQGEQYTAAAAMQRSSKVDPFTAAGTSLLSGASTLASRLGLFSVAAKSKKSTD